MTTLAIRSAAEAWAQSVKRGRRQICVEYAEHPELLYHKLKSAADPYGRHLPDLYQGEVSKSDINKAMAAVSIQRTVCRNRVGSKLYSPALHMGSSEWVIIARYVRRFGSGFAEEYRRAAE